MDATYRIQSNSATVTTAATSVTVTLNNPTTEGSTLVMFVASTPTGSSITTGPSSFSPPWAADASQPSTVRLWRRPDQPAGETSWTLNAPLAVKYAWRIDEWAAWSTVSQPDAMSNAAGTFGFISNVGVQNNNSVGTVGGAAAAPDISDFAALEFIFVSGGTGTFPLRSYSSGWSEVDYLQVGTGAATADFCIMEAESYPGVSGTCDCTMTWDTSNGGTYADKTVNVCVGCYRPAPPVPGAVVLTA